MTRRARRAATESRLASHWYEQDRDSRKQEMEEYENREKVQAGRDSVKPATSRKVHKTEQVQPVVEVEKGRGSTRAQPKDAPGGKTGETSKGSMETDGEQHRVKQSKRPRGKDREEREAPQSPSPPAPNAVSETDTMSNKEEVQEDSSTVAAKSAQKVETFASLPTETQVQTANSRERHDLVKSQEPPKNRKCSRSHWFLPNKCNSVSHQWFQYLRRERSHPWQRPLSRFRHTSA